MTHITNEQTQIDKPSYFSSFLAAVAIIAMTMAASLFINVAPYIGPGFFTARQIQWLAAVLVLANAPGIILVLIILPILRRIKPSADYYGIVSLACFSINPVICGLIFANALAGSNASRSYSFGPEHALIIATICTAILASFFSTYFVRLQRFILRFFRRG